MFCFLPDNSVNCNHGPDAEREDERGDVGNDVFSHHLYHGNRIKLMRSKKFICSKKVNMLERVIMFEKINMFEKVKIFLTTKKFEQLKVLNMFENLRLKIEN